MLCICHASAFLIHGNDAHMLQVVVVRFPFYWVWHSNKFYSLARCLHLMTSHYRSIRASHCLHVTRLILYFVETNLVAHLRILLIIRLLAHRLAVHKQFHFIRIGINHHLQFRTSTTVPVVAHTIVTRLHIIPHHFILRINHSQVTHRLVREETLRIVCLWLWLQRNVEHTLCPSLRWPSLTFAEIVDTTPIAESDDLVQVHREIVLTHRSHTCLALVECHVRVFLTVAREIHIAVVVALNIRNLCQVAWVLVRIPIAETWVHGNSR